MDTRERKRYVSYAIFHNGEKLPLDECEIEFQIFEEFADGDVTTNAKTKSARVFFRGVERLGERYMELVYEKEQNGK